MLKTLITYTLFLVTMLHAYGVEVTSSSATALNTVTLYADSTFIEDTNKDYKEGSLFKVLETSYFEHPDGDQKQKFKWFKVETEDKSVGWVFGDGLAVFVPKSEMSSTLQSFHNKQVSLSSGFTDATMWIASIQGRDNFHAQDYMNPLYNEYYLVITNKRGKSVLVKCSGESARGETKVHELKLQDITHDDYPEIIIQRGTSSYESGLDERELEIYSLKAGTLTSVFLEHVTLSYETNTPSPALYKSIEIGKGSIRVAYVDYISSKDYCSPESKIAVNPKREKCMEYVTAYYAWDKRKKIFKNLYGTSKMLPMASTPSGSMLYNTPTTSSTSTGYVSPNKAFNILKHYEEYALEGGEKKVKSWFYIQTEDGKEGYIPADKALFSDIEHADILNDYYKNTPLSKSSWKGKASDFLLGLK